ncbi:MAG TPA: cell division protein FtsQ/DivIB, partial [Rhodanobacter sp.]
MKGTFRLVAWCLAIALVALPIVGVLQGWFAANRWPVTQLTVQAQFKHVTPADIRAAVLPR